MKAILVLPVRHSFSSVVSSVKLEMNALNWNVIVFLSVFRPTLRMHKSLAPDRPSD